MMKDLKIYPLKLTKEHVKTIRFLNKECFPSNVAYGYTIKGVRWYIVLLNGTVAGFTSFYKDGERFRIFRMGVLKPFRGKGLQRQMVRFMEELAPNMQCKYITAETYYTNVPSANNFIKCGFTLYNPKKKRDKELLYFRKDIHGGTI